jgi:D-3-phosphoglycerate dehydrogenase
MRRRALRVFQVDDNSILAPWDFERRTLDGAGAELVLGGCETEDDIIERAGDAEVLWLCWTPQITHRVLRGLPGVRLAVRWGVGYEQIDVEAATREGVLVANCPAYGTKDVAEHTLMLLLMAARRARLTQQEMARGGWSEARADNLHRISGATLGIVGLGRIGSALATRAAPLGLRLLACDPAVSNDSMWAVGAEPVPLKTLLAESDYVSVHVPLTAETSHLFDRQAFAAMKPGSVLVNTCRGAVVDEAALVEALRTGHLAAAALDVFEVEPLPKESPLRTMPQVVLTPHMASFSEESLEDMRAEICRTTLEWARAGWASTVVNPEVRGRMRGGMPPLALAGD